MQDAQKALVEAKGDVKAACELLRKKGMAKASKRSGRTAKEGIIDCYVHGRKVGVMVEVNCETDFVAKTDDFRAFAHELALQIAASAPQYVSREDVPKAVLEKERQIIEAQLKDQQKPKEVMEKIIQGKLEKFYQEVCLLEQPSIKDDKMKVKQMLTDAISKFGENIVIARFTRYQLGEG